MIRILHIVHALTKGDGLCNMLMNYYNNIDRTKVQFDFLYFREAEADFKEDIISLGGRFYYMREPSFSYAFFKEREAFFKEHSKDYLAIHCHALFAVAFFSCVAKRYGIRNVIAHSHSIGCGQGYIFKKARNLFFVKIAKKLSTYHMACTVDAAKFMFGDNETRNGSVDIVNNAIDCAKFKFDICCRQAIRTEYHLENRFVIGHVGSFAVPKNHLFLINIFHEIQKIEPNSSLLLIGGDGIAAGSTKAEVQRRVEQLHLSDKVQFMGLRSDVHKMLPAMDAFVFPSLFEGFGIVLVEAQMSGLPCYASDVIPRDVSLIPSFEFISLKDSPLIWAQKIVEHHRKQQNDRNVNISNFGQYNIKQIGINLMNTYLSFQQ